MGPLRLLQTPIGKPGEPPLLKVQRLHWPILPERSPSARWTLEFGSFHEPYPLIPSFSPSGGEGARRAVEGDSDRFIASIRVRVLEVHPTHEPLLGARTALSARTPASG